MLAVALLLPVLAPVSLFRGAELPGQEIKYWSVEDTTLDSSQGEINLGGIAYLNGGPGKTVLIRFGDLRRALGPGRRIKSATLELSLTGSEVPRLTSVSDVLVPWNEGPAFVVNFKSLSSNQATAAPWSATYRARRAGADPIPWQSIGCSGVGDAIPIRNARGAMGDPGVFAISGIESAIQRTYDDPFEYGGLAIRFETPCEFFSSQAAQGRPRLVVETEARPSYEGDLSVILVSRSPWPIPVPSGEAQIFEQDGRTISVWPVSTQTNWPSEGESIAYSAKIMNVGTKSVGAFEARWGVRERWGGWAEIKASLEPGESTTVTFSKPFKLNSADHRADIISIEIRSAEDGNRANNGLEVPENGLPIAFAINEPKSSDPTNSRGSNHPADSAQAIAQLLNRVVLPNSRFSFAPDGPRERFFIQEMVDAEGFRGSVPTKFVTDRGPRNAIHAILSHAGLTPVHAAPDLARISGTSGVQEIRRPAPIAPSLFGGGETRFDGGVPAFLVMPPEPYSNPLFDNVIMEPSGLLSMTDVYGLESQLGKRVFASGQYLYDQPALNLFKAQAMDGRPLKNAKISIYPISSKSEAPAPKIHDTHASVDGSFAVPDRKLPIAHPRLKANPFGVIDTSDPNGGLVFEAEFQGQKAYAFLAYWQVVDMRARGGLNPVVYEIRFNVSDGTIDSTNLAKGRIVVDSEKTLPARLMGLVNDKLDDRIEFPSGEAAWIEIDLGRDRIVSQVDLVLSDGPFWDDFDIAGYNTGQTANEAVAWRRQKQFGWSRLNVAETEGSAKVVKFRAAAQQYRFLRIRNRGKAGPASLAEVRVFGGSAATP